MGLESWGTEEADSSGYSSFIFTGGCLLGFVTSFSVKWPAVGEGIQSYRSPAADAAIVRQTVRASDFDSRSAVGELFRC